MPEEPAEKAAIEHKERLYKAIAMLNDFIDGFSNIAPEEFRINPEEIADQSAEMKRYRIELLKRKSKETDEILKESPAQLFARRCEKEKLKNLYFNRKSFAKREKDRSMQVYELIKSLPGMILELDDTRAYVIASDYNQYLDDILSQKEPEGSIGTFEKLPSQYSREELGSLFDKCHSLRLTKPKDKELFISMFKCPEQKQQEDIPRPSGLVSWNGKQGSAPLYYLIHMITGRKPTAAMLRIYFKSNHTINDNQYQKDKDTGDYPITKLSAMIFSVVKAR